MWNTDVFSLLVTAFAPSLAFLGYFALKDRYEPEPLRLLLGTFAGGILAAVAALGVFELLRLTEFYSGLATAYREPEGHQLAYAFLAIGPVEEMAKFVAVWATVYRFRVIDEPVDGFVYACAAALGFATFENWYAMLEFDALLLGRALTLPFNHALFSSFWGYALGAEGQHGMEAYTGSRLVVAGLVLSIVYHGLYDFVLINDNVPDLLVLPLILLLWLWVQFAVKRLLARSPFRPK